MKGYVYYSFTVGPREHCRRWGGKDVRKIGKIVNKVACTRQSLDSQLTAPIDDCTGSAHKWDIKNQAQMKEGLGVWLISPCGKKII